MAKEKNGGERAVLICTAKRGIFFGYAAEECMAILQRGTVTLKRARMCTYWSEATKGVMGLAGIGPQRGSRIGPQVPELTCGEVTAAVICTDKAIEAWEAGPWS